MKIIFSARQEYKLNENQIYRIKDKRQMCIVIWQNLIALTSFWEPYTFILLYLVPKTNLPLKKYTPCVEIIRKCYNVVGIVQETNLFYNKMLLKRISPMLDSQLRTF